MKKKIIIPLFLLALVLIFCASAPFLFSSRGISQGQLYITDGRAFLVTSENSAMIVSDRTKNKDLFEKYENGDTLLLFHDGIAESFPAQTGGYYALRLSKGDGSFRPDDSILGVAVQKNDTGFEFSLTWGCYGISSYDSRTGKLVKTSHATHPEDYITQLTLTSEQYEEIKQLFRDLEIESYPDEYNPSKYMSTPSATLILTLKTADFEKTVTAADICLDNEGKDKMGQKFLDTCYAISEMLMDTEEWNALPDYEFYYD